MCLEQRQIFSKMKHVSSTGATTSVRAQSRPSRLGVIKIRQNDDDKIERVIELQSVLSTTSLPTRLVSASKLACNWSDDEGVGTPNDGSWESAH